MPRVPVPLTWKRRNFAVLQPLGTLHKLTPVAFTGMVAGPFAIHPSVFGSGPWSLVHLPSQTRIIDLEMQGACKEAAELFAACDVNWWTCITEEIIGPDTQELRNIYDRLRPHTSVTSDLHSGEKK
jgi:hypothetical protein